MAETNDNTEGSATPASSPVDYVIQEFFSLATGRRFVRVKTNWARDNAYNKQLDYFAKFGGNQFVKAIKQNKGAKRA